MNSREADVILARFLATLEGDWTPACTLASIVERAGVDDPAENRNVCLRVVRDCLKRGFARIGYVLRDRGFVPWEGEHAELIDRVAQVWSAESIPALGDDPCWFDGTEAAHRHLLTLQGTLAAELSDEQGYGYVRLSTKPSHGPSR
jgi:hypothetical protein